MPKRSLLRCAHPIPLSDLQLTGKPIQVRFRPELTVRRGRLHSRSGGGHAVHAGSFLRKRLVVLDSELLRHPGELKRIVFHEIWHFVWLRLGNPKRLAWERMLESELREKAPGELGWSAEWRKCELSSEDRRRRTRRWREYACESFCDTGAWLLASASRHREFTLSPEARRRRRNWFRERILIAPLPV